MTTEIKPEDNTAKKPDTTTTVATDTSKKLEKEVALDEEALDAVAGGGGRHVML